MKELDMSRFPLRMESGVFSGGHVQGIAVDPVGGYVYYSFTRSLVKADLAGNIIGTVKGEIVRQGKRTFQNAKYREMTPFFLIKLKR